MRPLVPGAVFAGEPPDDEQEAVAKNKRPQITALSEIHVAPLAVSPSGSAGSTQPSQACLD